MPNISANGIEKAAIPLLEMRNMRKEFPGVQALKDVSFTLRTGTVHALMGENGAGKSTLMKCLFGINQPDGGEILLSGRAVRFHNPKEALEEGVAMVHQEPNQALKRSVMDNMWLGRYPARLGLVSDRTLYEKTRTVLGDLGLFIDPRRIMGTMTVSERQMVEIAKIGRAHV